MKRQRAGAGDGLSILVIGNDTLIELLPARPIQVAHACGKLGFDLVIPLSWGDELVAQAAITQLADHDPTPAVMCACPLVRNRLLAAGTELHRSMVSLASPPVAVSRQLREALGTRIHSLAFAGRCPGARSPEFDLAMDPGELAGLFKAQKIDPEREPEAFENHLPPDRRRFASVPGGCPAPEQLWLRCNERVVVDLEGRDLAADLGQVLISGQSVLVDVAPALGCACSGVTTATSGRLARIAVASLEPPRSPSPVVEALAGIELRIDLNRQSRSSSRTAIATATDAQAPIETHREVAVEADPSLSAVGRPARPPIAVTPPSALRIPPRAHPKGSSSGSSGQE